MSPIQLHPGLVTGKSRAKADELRTAGEFAAAAEAYATIWPDGDRWTGWAFALCLRKTKRNQEALRVAELVVALAPDFERGRSILAWALFDSIRGNEELTPDLLYRAERIVELTKDSTTAYESVSPFIPTILRAARLLAYKGRYHQVLHWLERLDPSRLQSAECPFTDAKGKHRKLASQRERYHSLLTHALEKLEQWNDCLAAAEFALTACHPLHHDNDIWFARRVAKAKINLGRCEEGIAELAILSARKPASFIYYDIAEAAWKANDRERAKKHCVLALQSPGEIGYKLAALLLLSRILQSEGNDAAARRHLSLYLTYRKERGWRIPGEVAAIAVEWGASADANAGELLQQLKALWREWSRSVDVRRVGIIRNLLPHGRAGFIMSSDQERYFFALADWKDPRHSPKQGIQVSFATRPSYDRKHQRPSVVACDVRSSA
jgi:hypothetical protein